MLRVWWRSSNLTPAAVPHQGRIVWDGFWHYSDWWFGTFFIFAFSWECHDPNWRTPSFFRGVGWNHLPDIFGSDGCCWYLWDDSSKQPSKLVASPSPVNAADRNASPVRARPTKVHSEAGSTFCLGNHRMLGLLSNHLTSSDYILSIWLLDASLWPLAIWTDISISHSWIGYGSKLWFLISEKCALMRKEHSQLIALFVVLRLKPTQCVVVVVVVVARCCHPLDSKRPPYISMWLRNEIMQMLHLVGYFSYPLVI